MNALLRHLVARVPDAAVLLRREAKWLVTLALAFAGLWVFGTIADEVAENETQGFDVRVLQFFRTPGDLSNPIGPAWVERTAVDITALGGYPVLSLVTAIAVGYLLLVHRRGAALLVLVSIGGGMVLSQGLKALFERARPDLVPHLVDVHTLSFPSGHSTLSAVTYLTLAALIAAVHPHRRVKAYVIGWAVVLALLIGCSRVYLGVHWPTDVLAGWSIGAAWALLCRAIAEGLMRRRKIKGENPETPRA